MGRFYKPAKANQIDYAFRYPAQMFAMGVATKDAQVDAELLKMEQLSTVMQQQKAKSKSDIGSGMYLSEQEEAYGAEIQGFESEIEDITQAIYDDPFKASKQARTISDLRSRVSTSMTAGKLAGYNRNYNSKADFIEKNKDVSPGILNAAWENSVEKWKAAADETGELGELSRFLPPVVFDEDMNQAGIDIQKTIGEGRTELEEFSLIKQGLMDNHQAVGTLRQNLEWGLYGEEITLDGKKVKVSEMTPAQKNVFVDMALDEQALKTVALTYDYDTDSEGIRIPAGRTVSGKRTGASAEAIDVASKEGTGIIIPTIMNEARLRFPNSSPSQGTQQLQEYYQNLIVEDDEQQDQILKLSPARRTMYEMRESVIEVHIQNAVEYANTKIEGVGQILPGTNEEMQERWKNEYFNKQPVNTTVRVFSSWGDDFTEAERKQVIEQVDMFMNDPTLLMNAKLTSPDPKLNGTTLATLQDDDKSLIPKVGNQKEIDEFIDSETDMATTIYADIEEDNVKVTEEDGYKVIRFTTKYDENGDRVEPEVIEKRIRIETLPAEWENFSFDEDTKPIPTRTLDEYGNTLFRFSVIYNDKPTEVFISSDQIRSNTYDRVMTTGEAAIENYGASRYAFYKAQGFRNNEILRFSDNERIKFLPNGEMIFYTVVPEIGVSLKDEKILKKETNQDNIKQFLGLRAIPKTE